jgi:hypothetical protein
MSQLAVDARVASQRPRRRRGDTGLEAQPPASAPAPEGDALTNALALVVTYIPTEIIIGYVAVSVEIDDSPAHSYAGQWTAFWLFLALTPVVHWSVYARLLRLRRQRLPWHPRTWPWFGLVTGTVAFALWGFALPASPFTSLDWYHGSVAAVALIVGSVALGFAARAFGPLTPTPASED